MVIIVKSEPVPILEPLHFADLTVIIADQSPLGPAVGDELAQDASSRERRQQSDTGPNLQSPLDLLIAHRLVAPDAGKDLHELSLGIILIPRDCRRATHERDVYLVDRDCLPFVTPCNACARDAFDRQFGVAVAGEAIGPVKFARFHVSAQPWLRRRIPWE